MPNASIRIERFGGARPRVDSRSLGENEAIVAENCRLWSGRLGAWRRPNRVFGVGSNYLLWSNQFQQGAWTPTGLNGVTSNATNAPDGTLTADKLLESVANSAHQVVQAIVRPAVEAFWTAAVSAKAAERNFVWIRLASGVDYVQAIVNLTTGAVTSQTTNGAFSDRAVSVVAETNGFWRVHLTGKAPANVALAVTVGVSIDGAATSYAGTGNVGIYVDGASLRKSDKAGPYRETLAAALTADPTSIYGFRDQYWFVANEVRHFARAPIAADTVETTYFTRASGDPRVTYSPLAEDPTGSGDLPRGSFSMGLPVPANAPVAVLSPKTGNITNVTFAIGASAPGPIATQNYAMGAFSVDGTPVKVKANFKVSLSTLNTTRAVVAIEIQRSGFTGPLMRLEVPVEFAPEPVVGDTVVVEKTIEVEDIPPAGNATWQMLMTIAPYSGSVTPTYQHGGASVRYSRTRITSNAHTLVVGDQVRIEDVTGTEAVNVSLVEVAEVPDANSFRIDLDSLDQVYTGGGSWTLSVDDEDRQDTAYVFTWLSTIGGKVLEGPPSLPSNIIAKGDGEYVNLSSIDTVAPVDGGSYNFSGKRIYRTNVRSDLGANYQFVAEIAVGQNNYSDTLRDVALGEAIPSATWIKPPNDMHGLIEHTNGVLAGISGKEVCFCEPYQPHAWPLAYRLSCFSVPVALCSFGASIAVVTKGKPHIINGTVPGQLEMVRLDAAQPCLSELGAVDMGYACVYPGDDGLVSLSSAAIKLLTEEIFTREEWQELNPPSMRAAEFDSRYVCAFTKADGTEGGFILDPKDPMGTYTTLPFGFSALWTDPDNGTLYVLFDEYIAEWDAADDWFDYRWRSKTFETGKPVNFSVCKIEASDYPVSVQLYSNPDPSVIEEVNGVPQLELVDIIEAEDAAPFVLSGDYSGSLYQVEVQGNGAGKLKSIRLATSFEALSGG